jgi:hypothetical protein
MNEENGGRGGMAYAANPARSLERTIAAIESDRGGFSPRGFGVQSDSATFLRVLPWHATLEGLGMPLFVRGGGGSDIGPTVERGAIGFGLVVDDARYFDYHHSANDTIDKVHPRELELGAVAMAVLATLLSEEDF